MAVALLPLPPPSSAKFDFKTTTATTGGGTLSFLIFKFGGSREEDVVNDITFTYAVPPPSVAAGQLGHFSSRLDEVVECVQVVVLQFGN